MLQVIDPSCRITDLTRGGQPAFPFAMDAGSTQAEPIEAMDAERHADFACDVLPLTTPAA